MKQIMIIEDDCSTREELALLLKNEGYCPLPVMDFTDIRRLAEQERPDLILLDIGIPGRDGFSVCADLQKTMDVPVIFVTGRDSGLDEVRALSLGGDAGTAALTRNELRILACLMEHAGEIVSRADLIEVLWDSKIYIDDNTLSVNVTRLRGKLAELGLPELIKTRRGMGYQL